MTIPSTRSLIFEVKSTGSVLAFGRLRTSSKDFGRLRISSGIFGNDRVVFKNPSTPRIKISRLYLRKSWQVYYSIYFIWLPKQVSYSMSFTGLMCFQFRLSVWKLFVPILREYCTFLLFGNSLQNAQNILISE